ncbi:hypothetical protein [Cupriavidus basilensis]|nr:hypothetical protein [Cupriavidus basilensis]
MRTNDAGGMTGMTGMTQETAAAAVHIESAAAGRQRHMGRAMERLEDAAI